MNLPTGWKAVRNTVRDKSVFKVKTDAESLQTGLKPGCAPRFITMRHFPQSAVSDQSSDGPYNCIDSMVN